MVTAQNAKLLTSYRKEIKSNILDQKYKYAIEGIEKAEFPQADGKMISEIVKKYIV